MSELEKLERRVQILEIELKTTDRYINDLEERIKDLEEDKK